MSTADDQLTISELLYRYAELIDAGDFDGVGALLSRATFGGTGPQGVSGAENIAKLFAKTTRRYPDHGNTPRTRHLVLNPIVELHGDGTAASRSTFCVLQDTAAVPIQPIVVGRYFDTFGRDESGWHFTERKVEIQMIGNVSDHLMVDPGNFG
jgi:3-phenylpropionate/cinnamic acid dioxygenase small subunit